MVVRPVPRMCLRVDPPAIELTQAQADRLTGEYKNGTQTYKIRREGTHLFAVRTGEPEVEWKLRPRTCSSCQVKTLHARCSSTIRWKRY